MKAFFTLSFLFLCIYAQPVLAQPSIQWQKSLGGSGTDFAESMCPTADSGYLVIGYTNSVDGDLTSHHDSDEFWIVKLSASGVLQWQKTYGGSNNDDATAIIPTLDGAYMLVGESNSADGDLTFNHGGYDVWLVKINDTGKILWQKTYGGSNNDAAFAIIQTPDSGYIFSGYSRSNDGDLTQNAGVQDAWVVRINDTGKILWQRSFGGSAADYAISLTPAKQGGLGHAAILIPTMVSLTAAMVAAMHG
jgi:hypothetical protein